ncbi:type VII secretion target [[Mycobacterium] nativiensis]|uniref:Type VII secretion target n=1 Tax=[Mycobacterium] nativiensis TaxID=2855503 RepID=A0ABU5Y0X6_9MYCO|nr:type VII secretion target [Mycolicibacter sp. MYC340]MEB3033899.1 type VII secretion target [Mycolicibacter sp. MYC340]
MPQEIRVNQDVLTNAAGNHQEASDYLATVSASHEDLRATLNSLGPIYGDFRRAADSLLDARKSCYDDQSSEHSQVSDNLNLAVATWNRHEDDAAKTFRHLTDGR